MFLKIELSDKSNINNFSDHQLQEAKLTDDRLYSIISGNTTESAPWINIQPALNILVVWRSRHSV